MSVAILTAIVTVAGLVAFVFLVSSDRVSRIAVRGVEFERQAELELDEAISEILKKSQLPARSDLDDADAQKAMGRIQSGSAPVAHELALMRKYHAQGLAQSRLSFLLSLIFAGLGFAVIVFAIVTTDSSKSISEQSLPFASLVSAIVIEAVSGLFFVQSNRAQSVMVEFFDRLQTDRKLEEALALADRMPNTKIKARMMLVLGIGLADRPITDQLMRDTMGLSRVEGAPPSSTND
jgi:Flp pilus assembly protein TadB